MRPILVAALTCLVLAVPAQGATLEQMAGQMIVIGFEGDGAGDASVKAIAVDTPVEGRIVFTKRAKFPKGLPRFTVMLESVAAEFPRLGAAELDIAVAKYRPGWQRLKEDAKPSPHFRANPVAVA